MLGLYLFILFGVSLAQVTVTTTITAILPSYYHQNFTFPQSVTTRYATAVTVPASTTTYGNPFSQVSSLFANISTTTWPNWTPTSMASGAGASGSAAMGSVPQYGDMAYSALWNEANPLNFSRGLYSTTAPPQAVPSSELILPPPLPYTITPDPRYLFPADFMLAAAGSAAQCEGAIADEGKSPTLLDMLFTVFNLLAKSLASSSSSSAVSLLNFNNPLASDYTTNEHYWLYKQDIDRFAAIGLTHYSFSIPMSRIVPFALAGTPINQHAIDHYDDVINYMISKGITPIVTLFHWGTPLQFYGGGGFSGLLGALEDASANSTYGVVPGITFGFQNSTFEDSFVSYAQIVMSHYGDRVPYWVTFNEPQIGANNGAAVNTVIKSHARIVNWYRSVLNGMGKVSLKSAISPALPADVTNNSHVEAAETFNNLYLAPFLNPLVLGQDYPEDFKTAVPDYVPLTSDDLSSMKGTMDYISYDIYEPAFLIPLVSDWASCAANSSTKANPNRRFPICLNQTVDVSTGWAQTWTDDSGAGVTASSIRTQLSYFWNTYEIPIVISETGRQTPKPAEFDQNLDNTPQSIFLQAELKQVLEAIWEDGVHVMGLFVWNWGDDWEFTSYDFGFGLQFVNHTTQERAYRRSFFDVIDFVESRRLTCQG